MEVMPARMPEKKQWRWGEVASRGKAEGSFVHASSRAPGVRDRRPQIRAGMRIGSARMNVLPNARGIAHAFVQRAGDSNATVRQERNFLARHSVAAVPCLHF